MSNEAFKRQHVVFIQWHMSIELVGVSYRVPDATDEADRGMCKLLDMANEETSLIMGDFNYHID